MLVRDADDEALLAFMDLGFECWDHCEALSSKVRCPVLGNLRLRRRLSAMSQGHFWHMIWNYELGLRCLDHIRHRDRRGCLKQRRAPIREGDHRQVRDDHLEPAARR